MLRTVHVLYNQRNIPGFVLNPPALPEQVMREVPAPFKLFLRPGHPERHRHPREELTRRARHNHSSVPELRSVKRPDILKHKLPWIASGPVIVPLDIKPDHIIALG
jgi:hypothetical protein